MEFFTGFFGGEHPLDLCPLRVSLLLPSIDLCNHPVFVVDPAVEALAFQNANLDLDVSPRRGPPCFVTVIAMFC